MTDLTCPRCGAPARPPGLWSDSWTCPVHAAIVPLHPPLTASDEVVRHVAMHSQVPLWVPSPLPVGWLVSGLRWAGDAPRGALACVVACSGPNPLACSGLDPLTGISPSVRSADLLLVAEQPGVGLGAHLAGLPGIDPGETIVDSPPAWRLTVAGHDTPLWDVPATDRAAFVGEAAGVWLWVLIWPGEAGALLVEQFALRDLRDPVEAVGLPFGALCPRLE